eukprot:TRINITY_DN42564_c0_g1_i1.p1 TRINITY_DN42564_c0_g1~~TRINITY_DN42564_c0_g1_i1.p1  ORF type:complete len:444 (-),score=52.62 TRINITY_DN42564_c0_g1_i1:39-1265(-)
MPAATLKSALKRVADVMRDKYDMSVAAAFHTKELNFRVAAGFTDAGIGLGTRSRLAQPDDLYVWGSTTKMFTAPAVLQLIERNIIALADPISQHIDPILLQLNGTRLVQHFGPAIHGVQIQHLLHMTSGIQDYDGEQFAKDQFANRTKAFGPIEIIGKYVDPSLEFPPGSKQNYCSTNYILLGLVLATHYNVTGSAWVWQSYPQQSVIPEALRAAFHDSKFALSQPCNEITPVHGFMESYSTAKLPKQDVWNVSCLGGWTAGNYVGSVGDVARFTYELYSRSQPLIVSAASQALLTNFTAPGMGGFKFYGMGTFNLAWSVGDADAYGHVGDTYGYQSQTTYFPSLDFALSVATNIETASQAQPADFTCLAFHELRAVLEGRPSPRCNFTVPHRFIGTCRCTSPEAVVV